ncbi:MAG TPA: flagellar hook basal-body protein [Pirellulales bacterium]|jgi:flagellar basal-body rod protein FlgF/flagellar basal-body rod protein FlgG|nr:flagellar hook basal-body protein [Pirellulales bacterium]
MPYGLYISAEGAQAQSLRMEVIANNLANTNTPGFKRELAVFQSRLAEAAQRGLVPPGSGAIDDLGGGVDSLASITDFSPGAVKATGMPTDLAIEGDPFFVVRRDGKDLLTRAGNFMLTPAGMLVTQHGDPVMSTEGTPAGIDPERGPWYLTPDGAIAQAGDKIYLSLVRPRSYGDLVKTTDNLFAPLAPTAAVPATERHVLSGYLEQSGVQSVSEMTDMIETSRAFEANVNMIRSQDTILGELVSRVLKTG